LNIDGLSPTRVVQPETVDDLAEALTDERGSVVPIGAATQQTFGNPLRAFDCAVDLTRLNRVTEYVPADLTIHVEAGLRLNDLHRMLEENGQILPLDPFNGEDATIGGIAAANAQGAYRALGTLREWIIGMRVVEVNGTVSKAGGRVVKNVTGYDLAKLYTGSIGTLAIIAEISIKLRARFGRTATVHAGFADSQAAAQAITEIRKRALQPTCCEWIGPTNEIWLRFGEHPRAVEWQLKNLPPADWRFIEGSDETVLWNSVRTFYRELGPIVLKTFAMPTEIVDIINEFHPIFWLAHAMNGILLMSISDAAVIAKVRGKYRTVIERAPLSVRRDWPTFGVNSAEYDLMLKMKRAFDPDGRLNPGRHVDGETRPSVNR